MELYQEGVRGVFKNRLHMSAKFVPMKDFWVSFF